MTEVEKNTNENEIYFIENKFSNEEENKYSLLLVKAEKFDKDNPKEDYDSILKDVEKKEYNEAYEGNYIRFAANNSIMNANDSDIAKENIRIEAEYRRLLLENPLKTTEEYNDYSLVKNVYSYHINVGHGNCSIIVLEGQDDAKLWMIDCSNRDRISYNSYQRNINEALDHIKKKFNLEFIHIDKFFLTHAHHDHYSGVVDFINKGYIDSSTECYINLHYAYPRPAYINFLLHLNTINPKVVEPIEKNSTNVIDIWYPLETTVRANPKNNEVVEPSTNNASTVFQVNLGGKKMLFTGDIETKGLDKIRKCRTHLRKTNYYLVSHHGSLNGHIRTKCPAGRGISTISDCTSYIIHHILMGRDNAFSGIYSKQVIKDLQNKNLLYTEKDTNSQASAFLEINWQTNGYKHY